jgi:hypothetical protein
MVFSRPTRWLRSPTPQGIPAVAETAVEGLPELPNPVMDLWMLNEPVPTMQRSDDTRLN